MVKSQCSMQKDISFSCQKDRVPRQVLWPSRGATRWMAGQLIMSVVDHIILMIFCLVQLELVYIVWFLHYLSLWIRFEFMYFLCVEMSMYISNLLICHICSIVHFCVCICIYNMYAQLCSCLHMFVYISIIRYMYFQPVRNQIEHH